MNTVKPHKSSMGMEANIWALLVYIITIILGWIPFVQYAAWVFPLLVFKTEKDSDFVRFHAVQAVALYIVNAIVSIIVAIIGAIIAASIYSSAAALNFGGMYGAWGGTIALSAVGIIVGVILMIFSIIAMIKAYQYMEYRIPVIGALAEKISGSGKR